MDDSVGAASLVSVPSTWRITTLRTHAPLAFIVVALPASWPLALIASNCALTPKPAPSAVSAPVRLSYSTGTSLSVHRPVQGTKPRPRISPLSLNAATLLTPGSEVTVLTG